MARRAFDNPAKRAWWSIHVEAHRKSGLTVTKYCVTHGLVRWTFNKWRRELTDWEAQKSAAASRRWGQWKPISKDKRRQATQAFWASRPRAWAHTRRKFYEIAEADKAPIAIEVVRRIAEIYAIETRVRGQSPADRLAWRRSLSKPLVRSLKVWLEAQLPQLASRSRLAEAIRYALGRWGALCRFLDDGRVELDTNPVERAIRPVALGPKNHLFAGSDGGGARWATVCSLIETCRLNDVEPYAYLRDVLHTLVDGHPVNRLDELLPWAWKTRKAGNVEPSVECLA